MNEPNDNSQDNILCCQSIIDENNSIKRFIPIINQGIIIYVIILIVDLLYLNTNNLGYYLFLIFCLSLLSFNKLFLVLHVYTIISIYLIFGTIIPRIGIIIQIKFKNGSDDVIQFCFYFFIIIFSIFYFYFLFIYYKEIKCLFNNRIVDDHHIIPTDISPNNTDNNIYNENNNNSNNNNNQNNQKKNREFKAFSGKGYRVG